MSASAPILDNKTLGGAASNYLPLNNATSSSSAFQDTAAQNLPSDSGSNSGPDSTPDNPVWHTSTSLIGAPQYQDGFTHFNYVNPDAPKGGSVRLAINGTFDTLNFVPQKGNQTIGLGLIYDSLMTSSQDEQSTQYGLIAEALSYPDDYSSVKYRLNPSARWHDGQPITAEDVVWSFNMLVAHNRLQQNYYTHVEKAEALGPHLVKFTFDQTGNRELPQIVGQLIVLPKHWWEGTDANGNPRDITKSTLEPPLGSGPYKIGKISPGRSITYERAPNYWARDLAVNKGHYNFDTIVYEYYRDETVMLEAFKADEYDFRIEATARVWATGYNIPAVQDGRIVLESFTERGSGRMVGFIPNLRRDKFQDIRVRQALNLAFNFEELNKDIFFGQYSRIDSYFYGTELASSGAPQGLELEILEAVRDRVPEAVFTQGYANPTAPDNSAFRNNLRQAVQLFRDAGYQLKVGKMVNGQTGEPFEIEFLLNGSHFETIALRLQTNFARIGVELKVRIVDSSQWVNRVRNRDFDIIYTGWLQTTSPGNEQLEFFGSKAADQPNSRNFGGIQDEAVDILIQRIIFAENREELIAATKAMDRVLLANHYVIPGWALLETRTARWDRFSRPEVLPRYNEPAFPTIWWYDAQKAAKIKTTP